MFARNSLSRVGEAELFARNSLSRVGEAELFGRNSLSRGCEAELFARNSLSQGCGAELFARNSLSRGCEAELRGRNYSAFTRVQPLGMPLEPVGQFTFALAAVNVFVPSAFLPAPSSQFWVQPLALMSVARQVTLFRLVQ